MTGTMGHLLTVLTSVLPLLFCLLMTHHPHHSQAQVSNTTPTPTTTTTSTNNNGSSSVQSKRLIRADHCPGMVIDWAGRYQNASARRVLECLAGCGPDTQCLAIVFDRDSKECHYCNDTARKDCSNMVQGTPEMKYYETQVICEKKEEEPGPGGVCVCADGYRGDPCQPYIGDCLEGFKKGHFNTTGVYAIHPRISAQPFDVFCKKMPNNIRTYILERRDNKLNFNRTYAEYRAGFGILKKNHWLGLDKVYELTNSKTYELRVSAKLSNGSNWFMQYQQFNITSKEDGYRLRFNLTFAETFLLGDCFTPLLKSQFSAMDHDRDEDDSVNCAAKHGGGWWFRGKNCSTCNPTGPLLLPENGMRTGVDAEIFWTEDLGDMVPMKMTMFLVYLG